MTENAEGEEQTANKPGKQRKPFISPTSSFIDFGNIENEFYTEEGISGAALYNPHKERVLKRPASNFEISTHLLKGSIGCGLLAMPKAFSNCGIVTGVIFTVFLTMLCIYSMTVLLKTQNEQCRRLRAPFIPLPASMRIGFKNGPKCLRWLAPLAAPLVDFFLVSCQLGFCTAYVIFIASSIKTVAEPRIVENVDIKIYILMIFIPVCLTNYIRDLKKLTPLSLLSNILIFVSLICCFYIVIFVGDWKIDSCENMVSPKQWPLYVGTVLFALEAVGVIVTLEHNMKNPDDFLGCRGIFPWCLILVSSLYMFVGLVGYLKYGNDVSETIFASLPNEQWLALACYALYGFCIFLTYPLQCFVPLEILWGNYIRHIIKNPLKEFIFEYMLRTGAVLLTFIAALVIPRIDVVISLIGAFCISWLGLIFPFLLELLTRYPTHNYGFLKWVLIKDILLIIFGFLILIMGTYESLDSFFSPDS